MKKFVSLVLSLILTFSIFNAVSFGAFAETGPDFVFTDFEDNISPFYTNDSNKNVGKVYTDLDGNKSLFVYNSGTSIVPSGKLSDNSNITQANIWQNNHFSSVIGSKGYRPVSVSFKLKPIFYQSNAHLLFYPLTFSGSNTKNPVNEIPIFSLFFASRATSEYSVNEGKLLRYLSWDKYSPNSTPYLAGVAKPLTPATASKSVFPSNTEVDNTAKNCLINASRVAETLGGNIYANSDRIAYNENVIKETDWCYVTFDYTWNDENRTVLVKATLTYNNTDYCRAWEYKFNKNLVSMCYNFGICQNGNLNGYLMDDLSLISENTSTGELFGPHTEFVNSNKEIINCSENFNIEQDYVNLSSQEKLNIKQKINDFNTGYNSLPTTVKNSAVLKELYNKVDAVSIKIKQSECSHTYSGGGTVTKPTCKEEGYTTHICSKCGYEYKDTYTPIVADNHKWSAWDETSNPATYEKDGEKVRTCEWCNKEDTQAIPKLNKTDLSKATVVLGETEYTYTGEAFTPSVTVKVGGKAVPVSEYEVAYSENVNAGNGTVTVTAKEGNVSVSGSTTASFKINKASAKTYKLSTTSVEYNGKVKTPTVTVKTASGKVLKKGEDYTVTYAKGRKNVGKYTVKVELQGNYTGSKTLSFTINPKKVGIKKATAGKKKITVTWTSQKAETTGYQIQYSTSSKFKSAKTVTVSGYKSKSKAISKLTSKKTYYVKLRTYKTVGKTKYYSDWSSAKKVKVK